MTMTLTKAKTRADKDKDEENKKTGIQSKNTGYGLKMRFVRGTQNQYAVVSSSANVNKQDLTNRKRMEEKRR